MAFVTPRMSLKVWNSAQDAYSHEQLADNFIRLDQHDHTAGRGSLITGAAIADGSIEDRHIFSLAGFARYVESTYSTRPSAGIPGRLHRSTDAPNIAMDTGTTWTELIPLLVSSLPGSPYDTQEVHYIADATNGVIWHLRYRSLASGSHKWEFVGGAPLTAEVATFATLGAPDTWSDLSATGPSIAVPLAGDYEFTIAADIGSPGSPGVGKIGLSLLGSSPGTNDTCLTSTGVAASVSRPLRRTMSTSGTAKLMYYSQTNGGATFQQRVLSVRPIRVG